MKKIKELICVLVVFAMALSIIVPRDVSAASATEITLKYKNKATVPIGKTKLGVKASVKSKITYKTSDKKVAKVKKGVLYAYKPGKVTITITATPKSSKYQKATKKVTFYISPKATKVTSVQRSGSSLSVTVKKAKYATGYQFQVAGNKSFTGAKSKRSKTVTAMLSSSSAGTVYVRVRPYAKVGKKTVYGKWSKAISVSASGKSSGISSGSGSTTPTPTATPTPTPTQTYSYELVQLTDAYNNEDLYTLIYLKTNDPSEKFYYELDCSHVSINYLYDVHYRCRKLYDAAGNYLGADGDGNIYTLSGSEVGKNGYIPLCSNFGYGVTGGWIGLFTFNTTGTHTLKVYTDPYNKTDSVVATLTIKVMDYEAEKLAWEKELLDSVTNSSMTDKQKLTAIVNYFISNYTYEPTVGGDVFTGKRVLTSENFGKPVWITKQMDCWDATSIMIDFAEILGLNSEAVNAAKAEPTAYGGTDHMYAKIYLSDGTSSIFDACPTTPNILTTIDYII